jgi:hypothetical protein
MITAVVVLICYSIAMIVAGHGAVPMAALLVMGDLDSWFVVGKILGWTGIIGLVAATFLVRSDALRRLSYQFLATSVLYLSWLVVAILGNNESGSLWSSFVLSVPLHIAFLAVAFRLVAQLRRARAGSLSAP